MLESLVDIKPDNIMIAFKDQWTSKNTDDWVKTHPPGSRAPEKSPKKWSLHFTRNHCHLQAR